MTKAIELVARATHEVNRAYCAALGDNSQASWEDAPEWQKASAIAGVESVLSGAAKTPEEQHQLWLDHKKADGWVYGAVKDAEAKTHPCFVPYAELPPEQKAKDYLFRAVCKLANELVAQWSADEVLERLAERGWAFEQLVTGIGNNSVKVPDGYAALTAALAGGVQ